MNPSTGITGGRKQMRIEWLHLHVGPLQTGPARSPDPTLNGTLLHEKSDRANVETG